jgi:hypothetical protein
MQNGEFLDAARDGELYDGHPGDGGLINNHANL